MNPELDEKLTQAFPKIFCNRHGHPQTTAMCWGFDHGEGWYQILKTGCTLIQNHIDNRLYTIHNWQKYNQALEEAIEHTSMVPLYHWYSGKPSEYMDKAFQHDIATKNYRVIPPEIPQLVAFQVKEKFGTLRFYYDGGDDFCSGVVSMMESMTYHTCEVCGNLGKVYNDGWVVVRCDQHKPD